MKSSRPCEITSQKDNLPPQKAEEPELTPLAFLCHRCPPTPGSIRSDIITPILRVLFSGVCRRRAHPGPITYYGYFVISDRDLDNVAIDNIHFADGKELS